MIEIHPYNESFVFIRCDIDEAINISQYFEFFAPNYIFSPKYKMGVWDGKIRLFNTKNCLLPIGLLNKLSFNLKRDGKQFKLIDKSINSRGKKISSDNVKKFTKMMNCPFMPYDHQILAVQYLTYLKKGIVLSSTASGKSYIAFLLFNLLRYMNEDYKFLLVVPTVQLVTQMRENFIEYGSKFLDYNDYIHMIFAGKDKYTDKPITISTWQSLQKLPPSYFEQFNCILVDEVHKASGKELSRIIQSSTKAEYKLGLTGTLKNAKTDKLQLEALFGNIKRVSKTKDLQKKGFLTKIKVNGIILNYSADLCKLVKKLQYTEEVDLVNKLDDKKKYISKLSETRKGNTLILFRHIEYGKEIEKYLSKSKKKVFYIDGSVSVEKRQGYTQYCEDNDDTILLASYGTFSTGINIKNLHNIIFAESMKSMIVVLQSIGRGLRLHKSKNILNLYDIADNFTIKKSKNYLMKHFMERISYYDEEEFGYTIKEIKI